MRPFPRTTAFILLLALLLSGCSVNYENVELRPDGRPQMPNISGQMERNIRDLAGALLQLGPNVSRSEAMEIAYDAYIYPLYLADAWNVTWPPLYHNTLRNSKVRIKGLCTDWADAMVSMVRRKNLQTFDIYWGVAFKGDPWREHSTLLVTAKGQPFYSGIILDPWRNSGKLYWLNPLKDPTYVWKYHAGPFGPLPALNGAQVRASVLAPPRW
ncbi:MAG: hypothetical protein KDI15_03125 [Thiothrix sp.]|nr:hypothetical protein [Thiothrix sp.]HPE59816.1 hypothetical protein [Thiolinea sp.]